MKKDRISWGIIGCGDVAEIKSGPAFQKCKDSELVAVMRRDASLAEDFAQRHNVPFWYDNAEAILTNSTINAVYIATPPSSHYGFVVKALKAGKDVYVEKPMVLTKEEAASLSKIVQESSQKLVVAHYRRYLPMYIKIKKLLDQNFIGEIHHVDIRFLQPFDFNSKATWRLDKRVSGGGYFHDLAPHQLDLMYYFFGNYTNAYGIASNQASKYEADDTVNGIINFENKIQFRGFWSFAAPEYLKSDTCSIYGSTGTMQFSFYEDKLTIHSNGKYEELEFENPTNIQQPMIQETVDYFLGKRDNPCSVIEGEYIMTLMFELTNKG